MKAAEVRLFIAIAAQNGLKVLQSDTKQAFLDGEKGEEQIYIRMIRAPDWWPEPVPEGQHTERDKMRYKGMCAYRRGWNSMDTLQ